MDKEDDATGKKRSPEILIIGRARRRRWHLWPRAWSHKEGIRRSQASRRREASRTCRRTRNRGPRITPSPPVSAMPARRRAESGERERIERVLVHRPAESTRTNQVFLTHRRLPCTTLKALLMSPSVIGPELDRALTWSGFGLDKAWATDGHRSGISLSESLAWSAITDNSGCRKFNAVRTALLNWATLCLHHVREFPSFISN